MKKSLLLTTLLLLGTTTISYAHPGPCGPCGAPGDCPPPPQFGNQNFKNPPKCKPKVDIEKKLKLTEEQKAKAKELRMQSREEMRPIVNAIRTKTEQKEIIKRNKSLTAEAQCQQVEKLNNQINELKKQARDIRLKNERDFEALLTPKQKKELNKIKEQAKKDMQKHKCPPPPFED